SFVMTKDHGPDGTVQMRPGPIQMTLENRSNVRTFPGIWIVSDKVHDLVSKRRPFLTAKRLLTNQTFRDIYRTDTLDVDQRLKIRSEEHTSELQSRFDLVCRLLLEKKN